MAEGTTGEKTEEATPHKRREQRKEGNVMQSKDVVTAAFIMLAFFILRLTARHKSLQCLKPFFQVSVNEVRKRHSH